MGAGNGGCAATRASLIAMVWIAAAGPGCSCTYESSRPREDSGTSRVDGGGPPGVDGEAPDSAADAGDIPDPMCIAGGEAPLRRMTADEMQRAFVELIGTAPASLAVPSPFDFVPPEVGYRVGFEAGTTYVETMYAVAREAAAHVVANIDAFAPCPGGVMTDICAESFVRTFVARAFRRPLADEEVAFLVDLFRRQGGGVAAIGRIVEATFQSPHFAYRIEIGRPDASGGSASLTGHEIATRLAALLWASVPDAILLEAAATGRLDTSIGVEEQARRMLADPRAREGVTAFARQWLGYESVTAGAADADLASSMLTESDAFVRHAIFDADGRFETLLTSPFTLGDARVAAHYGAMAPDPGVHLVALDPAQRASVVTHGAILATTRTPTRRGMLVRSRFLCQDIPPPPPDTGFTVVPGPGQTRRQALEELTAEPACSACHRLVDPIGFAFESYDATGAYRTVDNGLPIDDSGEIVDGGDASGTFTGAVELAHRLAASDRVQRCFGRQWMRYALRRGDRAEDACALERMHSAFARTGGDVREMLVALTSTETFRTRTPLPPFDGGAPHAALSDTPLDVVIHHLSVLVGYFGPEDRILLERHLESVRELQRRTEM